MVNWLIYHMCIICADELTMTQNDHSKIVSFRFNCALYLWRHLSAPCNSEGTQPFIFSSIAIQKELYIFAIFFIAIYLCWQLAKYFKTYVTYVKWTTFVLFFMYFLPPGQEKCIYQWSVAIFGGYIGWLNLMSYLQV